MLTLTLLLACTGGHGEGTAVGNPGTGSLDVVVTEVPDGIALDEADAAVDTVTLDDCEGGQVPVPVEATLDALPGSADAIDLPGGDWCGLTLAFLADSDPLLLLGQTDGGTRFEVALDPGPLTHSDRFSVDSDELLLALSLVGTLDAATLEEQGEDVQIAADDAQALSWADALASHSRLWLDEDGDADVDAGDQLASDQSAAAFSESAGCGCATGGAGPGGLSLALGLAALLRRRPRQACPGRAGPAPRS